MKRLGVIVCNSGLGHLKRVLMLLPLVMKDLPQAPEIDVFVHEKKLKFFPALMKTLRNYRESVNFFNVRADVVGYESEFMLRYRKKLNGYDWIWSDNLSFPLRYHPQVFLTGQFLWSDNIKDAAFSQDEIKILKERSPSMLGIKYFVTPNARRLTAFEGTGIYRYFPARASTSSPDAILLVCGTTESGNSCFEKQMDDVLKQVSSLPPDIFLFIEPKYFNRLPQQSNILKATFTEEMFERVGAAVIRPGIGTVCDVLSKGSRIFAFGEGDNFEIQHNAAAIEENGIGQACDTIAEAFVTAVDYLRDRKAQQKHLNQIRQLNFNGLKEVMRKIKGIIQKDAVIA